MSSVLVVALCVAEISNVARPPLFAARPAMFASEASPAKPCECRKVDADCTCPRCECDRDRDQLPTIGAVPLQTDADGRVRTVANTCYQTCRDLAQREGRPLVVLIGNTPPDLARHAGDNPVIYSAAADPLFPLPGLYRYDHQPGKVGLYETAKPSTGDGGVPRGGCVNGSCRRR